MSSGTGNLPNPSMSFSPFAILTAEEMNDLVDNIEALAGGSGIGDGAIGTAALANNGVTPGKLSTGLSSVWQTLADVSVSGSAAQNLLATFTPMRFMEIEVNGVVAATGQMISLQFNSDAGATNYPRYTFVNGTAQSANTSGILIGSPATNGVEFSAWFKMAYRSASVPPNGSYMSFIIGGDQRMGSFAWNNASAAMTTARLNCVSGNGLGVGTRLVIKGHN